MTLGLRGAVESGGDRGVQEEGRMAGLQLIADRRVEAESSISAHSICVQLRVQYRAYRQVRGPTDRLYWRSV